ncbi:hypothetical protein VTL71DRAFT_2830 [Oculimacula yallundae]|uniref:Uncharacterized protein n=1 Tax=Oculimacula yallundae TaxID=86028 RepID=A0ABR4CC89_9HELO
MTKLPHPSNSSRRPSALSRHSSLSFHYSPSSCDITPLLPATYSSEQEARRVYRRGKLIGVLLALGFAFAVGVVLGAVDYFVWSRDVDGGI